MYWIFFLLYNKRIISKREAKTKGTGKAKERMNMSCRKAESEKEAWLTDWLTTAGLRVVNAKESFLSFTAMVDWIKNQYLSPPSNKKSKRKACLMHSLTHLRRESVSRSPTMYGLSMIEYSSLAGRIKQPKHKDPQQFSAFTLPPPPAPLSHPATDWLYNPSVQPFSSSSASGGLSSLLFRGTPYRNGFSGVCINGLAR